MKRSECTGRSLKEIGWEEIPATCGYDYVTPLKDVAFLLRECGYDCKVELDTSKEYVRTPWATFEARTNIYYNFDYMYIREDQNSKWQLVARREHVIRKNSINKALD